MSAAINQMQPRRQDAPTATVVWWSSAWWSWVARASFRMDLHGGTIVVASFERNPNLSAAVPLSCPVEAAPGACQ